MFGNLRHLHCSTRKSSLRAKVFTLPWTVAVETTTQTTFSAGRPRLLFEGQYEIGGGGGAGYDVTPDGQHFLVRKAPEQEEAATLIHVVLNWVEELRRRVPPAK